MLKIKIVAVGRVKEPGISSQIAEFQKRIRPFAELTHTELKDEGLTKEAAKLENHMGPNTYVLDEGGKMQSSVEFAAFLKKAEGEITFILGGPEGVAPEVKQKSKLISLSKMTFTHEMAKLFLIEQLYRACMINSGRGYYHK